MKLTASLTSDKSLIQVIQEGGFSGATKKIMKAISHGSQCVDGTYWMYPKWPGTVVALEEAAEFLGARLNMDHEVIEVGQQARNLMAKEHAVRKLIQTYMDEDEQQLAGYNTRGDPEPWRHQQIAYHWASRADNLYLAHKPGLGKTRSGTDIIRGRIDAGDVHEPTSVWCERDWSIFDPTRVREGRWSVHGGVLVVCPKVVLTTWIEDLWKWQQIPAQIISHYTRAGKERQASTPAWVHVCTYDSLDVLEGNRYDGIIADEMHYCAWAESARWEKMMHFRQWAKWAVALSGTPLSNRLPSLWAQYYWLDQGRTLGASYDTYLDTYFDGGSRRNPKPKPDAKDRISQKISRITYFLNMQQAFKNQNKEKIQQVIRVPMTSEQLDYYKQVHDDARATIQTSTVKATDISTKITKLLQIIQGWVKDQDGEIIRFSSAKRRALKAMLTGDGDLADERVIIWCRFRHDIDEVVSMLNQAGKPTLFLHGKMNDAERKQVRDAWNTDHRWRCMVGMIQMGIGINLHAPNCVDEANNPAKCYHTVFYGLDWKVTQLEQAMDRIYRGDQTETCLYRYILTENLPGRQGEDAEPFDYRVYSVLQSKLNESEEVSEESVEYIRRLLAA